MDAAAAPSPTPNVVLGISGGIAAYKAAGIASSLTQKGCAVTTVLTPAACEFIQPLTFEALTGRPCLHRLFAGDGQESAYPHLGPAFSADLAILAPATADLLARLAHGLANDLLSTLCLALRCPILACPSMNKLMWEHPATQRNLEILKTYGYEFVGPVSGYLACGMEGAGRLAEPEDIVARALQVLHDKLKRNATS